MSPENTLDRQDDPDIQIPMPFAAAEAYARQVMAWSREALPAHVRATRDVAYGPHRLHRYDVFAPVNAHEAPVLVFWHGGGWTNGYRAYNHFMAQRVVEMGCVLVTPSYRLVTEARFPAAFEDGLAALAHLRQNLQELGGSVNRIYLAGHSAGGHLVTMLYATDWQKRQCDTSCIIGGMVLGGVYDLEPLIQCSMNVDLKLNHHTARAASPIKLVPTLTVPLHVAVGADESRAFRTQSHLLAAAWPDVCGMPEEVENANHFTMVDCFAQPGHNTCLRVVRLFD